MHTLYELASGPLVWLSVILFLGGLLYKFIRLTLLARKKDPMVFEYLSLKYSLRSIIRWNIPFATRNMRLHPFMTVVSFVFHLCLFLSPIFLLAHVLLFQESFGLAIWTLPEQVTDWMTVLVLLALLFFGLRRVFVPEVRYVTGAKEYLVIILVALPFLTGFLAYHQIGPYLPMLLIHMLSGELLLALIPFTWLSHMILGLLIRAYMGSEFGSVRHARDW
ncbi:MAG: TmcC family electron transfer complex membrane anchor subunit [Desulfovibrionales bacterium]